MNTNERLADLEQINTKLVAALASLLRQTHDPDPIHPSWIAARETGAQVYAEATAVNAEASTSEARAQAAAEALINAVNEMSFDNAAFVETVRRTHPTIQQCLAGAVFALIRGWDEDFKSSNFDLRNEDTARIAHKMMSTLTGDDLYTRYI